MPPPLANASTRAELTRAVAARSAGPGGEVVLVPTMGALHDGHEQLMRAAREGHPDATLVVSIFVNPLQFGPGEDLARYPRTLDADLALCARAGVDVVFAPALDEVYPDGAPQVTVDPGPLGADLEGAVRPGHFAGMLVVVAKLFGLVRPDVAVFGEKDYQQLVLIRRMVVDLCLRVDIVGVETVREADGLALSSRNRFLEPADRSRASVLSRALRAAQEQARYGVVTAREAALAVLSSEPEVRVDYLAIRSPELTELDDGDVGEARVLVAARVGTTRLIDNLSLTLGGAGSS
ncbi:MAG: pantoate--beta-alanine ligase [Nocardioidaceae bacterium]|nr:pantoate--beta-alanine ligase [Nocardioidaceae bacterium]